MIPDLSAGTWVAIAVGSALWVGMGWTFLGDLAHRLRSRR